MVELTLEAGADINATDEVRHEKSRIFEISIKFVFSLTYFLVSFHSLEASDF